jgi:hypothetical protein
MKTVIPIKQVSGKPPVDDGWRALSTLSEPRLSEMAENYKTLGYEVEIRDIQRNEGGCNTCFDAGQEIGQVFGTLYVRKRDGAQGDTDFFE